MAILNKEFCANKNIQCPIPFPLPLFSPWAGQQLKSLPMGEKRGRGKGMGHCFCCPHTMGSPCEVWETAKICAAFSHLFVNLINTRVRHPVDYKHTEHWGCGNPKQRVLCNISWGATAPQTPPRPLACVAFCDPIFSVIFPGGPLPPRPPLDHWHVLHFVIQFFFFL